MSEQPTDRYSHVPDGAATGDGRAIAFAVLVLADEVRALCEALTLTPAEKTESEGNR